MTVLRTRSAPTQKMLQRAILGQMKDLSLDGLLALHEFALLLRQRPLLEPNTTPFSLRQPTVEMPADSLLRLVNLMPSVGGDALLDSESLYDQV